MSDDVPVTPTQRHALVIGVNGSAKEELPFALEAAERDARAMATALEAQACGFTVQLLTGADVRAHDLKRVIEDALYAATESSELLFYFSGHALSVAHAPRQTETYLVTSDFEVARARRVPDAFLSLRWLYDHLYRDEVAAHVVLILDCCYAGNLLGLPDDRMTLDFRSVIEQFREGLDAQTRARYHKKLRVLIAAAGPDEQSHEHAGVGLLTAQILTLLRGDVPPQHLDDGRVTVELLIDRLKKVLPEQLPAPLLVGEGLCVLADHTERVRPAAVQIDPVVQREQRLRSICHDHSGFIQNRLASFVGRESERAEIHRRLAHIQPNGGYVTVTGQAGQGKSSILAKILDELGPHHTTHHFIPFKPGPDHQVGLMRDLLAQLCLKYGLDAIYVAAENRSTLRDYFARALRELAAAGHHEIILIDGLDQIEEDLSGVRDLSFLPLEPPAGIVFLLSTRPNDTLKPLELRKPHHEYWLPNLSRSDFALLLQHRGVTLDTALADRFYVAMQENALYLDLVAMELHALPTRSPEALIARIANNPDNIFSLSIERLKTDRQRWRTLLKPILGFLLAARNPLSGRALRGLTHSEDDECREGLQRLGGLLARDGEGRYYIYHLKLNDYLREDPTQPRKEYIFARDEEESYHQRLADWAEGGRGGLATIWQDAPATEALEHERRHYARYHYITHLAAARNDEQIWTVVDRGDYGRAKLRYDPSGRMAVLDLDTVRDALIASMHADREQAIALMPRLFYASLMRGRITSQADQVSDDLFVLMVQLGRAQEAFNTAELLTNPARKVVVLLQIGVASQTAHIPPPTTFSPQVFARAQTLLSDLWSQEPQRVIADFENLWKFLLRGHPEVIAILSHAIPHPPLQPLQDEDEDTPGCLIPSLVMIATALIQTGEWAQAVSLDKKGNLTYDRLTERLASMTQALIATDRLEPVLAMLLAIRSHADRALVLRSAAQVLEMTDHTARATELHHASEQALNQVEQDDERAEVLAKIVQLLASMQRFDEALVITRSIEDDKNRAQALAYAQQFEEALVIACSIKDDSDHAKVLAVIASHLAQAQRFDEALATARSIEDTDKRINVLTTIVQHLAKAQRFEEAIETARSIKKDNYRISSLTAIAAHLVQAQRFDEATVILDEELATTHSIENGSFRDSSLATIAKQLAQAQRFDEALATAYSIEGGYSRAKALAAIAAHLVQAQRFDEATVILDEVLDTARTIKNDHAQALAAIATHLAQAQRFDEALAIARSIKDAYSRSNALAAIATHLAQAQQFDEATVIFDEALATARSIENDYSRAKALAAIAEHLAHRFDEALATARSIEDDHFRAQAIAAIAKHLAQAQRFDEALATARSIEGYYSRDNALTAIAAHLAQAQRFDEAAVIFDEALATARSIKGADSRTKAITNHLTQAQRFDEALATARSIKDAYSRSNALAAIAAHLAQVQRFDEALATARSINRDSERATALAAIATHLAQVRRFDDSTMIVNEAITLARNNTDALIEIAETYPLTTYEQIANFILHSWREAQTYAKVLQLAVLPQRLFASHPQLGVELVAAIERVGRE